jgi:hypothetical protein
MILGGAGDIILWLRGRFLAGCYSRRHDWITSYPSLKGSFGFLEARIEGFHGPKAGKYLKPYL